MLRACAILRARRLAPPLLTASRPCTRGLTEATRSGAAEPSPPSSSSSPSSIDADSEAKNNETSSGSVGTQARSAFGAQGVNIPRGGTMGAQLAELKRVTADLGGVVSIDGGVVDGAAFPELGMTSLSGSRVVISERAGDAAVTLVLLAYRSFADTQLASWRTPFEGALGAEPRAQIFDVSVNETFAAQALSGFVRRLQRSSISENAHEFYVALNEPAGDNLEALLPSDNRLFGYALLLDRDARVRFRAAGKASAEAQEAIVVAANQIILLDEQGGGKRRRRLVTSRKNYSGGTLAS
jgi:ATP10 protein